MLIIYIKDLVVEAKHGVHAHEKVATQRFNINVELTIDSEKASLTDDLNDTIDWSLLRKNIIDTTVNNSFNLVEKLAREIADKILQNKEIKKVKVSVDKLDAFETGTPGVTIDIENSI